MSGRQQQTAIFTALRGRDGHAAAELEIPGNKARECLNVEFFRTAYARKRMGALSANMALSTFTRALGALHRHVPGADDRLAELWGVDETLHANGGPFLNRWNAGTWKNILWAVTPGPGAARLTGPACDVNFVSFNGKLYILGMSGIDQLQVFDPGFSETKLRFAGVETGGAVVATNDTSTAAPLYPAVTRFYRGIYAVQGTGPLAGITIRRSLAGPAHEFKPSGLNTKAIVNTFVPLVSTGEITHWELYGAELKEGPYYLLGTAVAFAAIDDTTVPSEYYKKITLMPLQGDNTPPWSAKYGITDDNRLLLAGAWEPGHSQNEVWFSPVLGSTSVVYQDDERFPSTNKISFNERDSSYITGLGGPIGSTVIVFKTTQTWRLMPTGDVDNPYRRRLISKAVGCLHQRTVVVAEDETGIPTIYWLSAQGPYRFNLASGLARLTWDIQDIWDRVNINADIIGHGVWHPDKHQIWWWVAVDSEKTPLSTRVVYDTHLGRVVDAGLVRDGWSVYTGASSAARCSVMWSRAFTVNGTSRETKPYIGVVQLTPDTDLTMPLIWQCDANNTSDNGFPFQAYVRQPHRHLAGLGNRFQLGHTTVLGAALAVVPTVLNAETLVVMHSRDYGAEERATRISMATDTSSTRVLRIAEGVETADAECVALQVGDANPLASAWVVDAVMQPFEIREPVVS